MCGLSGSALIEAVAAAALAAIAVGTLTGVATLASRTLALARDTDNALALAGERLETLRNGPRADGTDTAVTRDGTVFTRSWHVGGGRGAPVELSVQIAWGRHALALSTATLP